MTEAAPGVLNLDDTLEILGIQERSVVEEAGERTEGVGIVRGRVRES